MNSTSSTWKVYPLQPLSCTCHGHHLNWCFISGDGDGTQRAHRGRGVLRWRISSCNRWVSWFERVLVFLNICTQDWCSNFTSNRQTMLQEQLWILVGNFVLHAYGCLGFGPVSLYHLVFASDLEMVWTYLTCLQDNSDMYESSVKLV